MVVGVVGLPLPRPTHTRRRTMRNLVAHVATLLALCRTATGLVGGSGCHKKRCTALRATEDDIARRLGRVEGTAESCLNTLNGCKEESLIRLWDSEASLRYRPTSLEALEGVGLSAQALGVTAGDSIDDLANGLAFVAVASAALAIAAGGIVGGNRWRPRNVTRVGGGASSRGGLGGP